MAKNNNKKKKSGRGADFAAEAIASGLVSTAAGIVSGAVVNSGMIMYQEIKAEIQYRRNPPPKKKGWFSRG